MHENIKIALISAGVTLAILAIATRINLPFVDPGARISGSSTAPAGGR